MAVRNPRVIAAIAGSFLVFIVVGAIQAVYGPLLPRFMETYRISYTDAGLILSVHFIGSIVGGFIYNPLQSRGLSNRVLIIAFTLILAAGSGGIALAPNWYAVHPCAFGIGVGFGALLYGLNSFFTDFFSGRRATAMVNMLNASLGFGSVMAPLCVLALHGSIVLSFSLLALVSLASISLLVFLPSSKTLDEGAPTNSYRMRLFGPAALIFFGFLAIYTLHSAIQMGIGGWEQAYLEQHSFTSADASWFVSLFWIMTTMSRVIAASAALIFSERLIIGFSLIGMTASLFGASAGIYPAIFLTAVGFFIGPIFPTGISWIVKSLPTMRNALALIMALSMLGPVVFPPVIGALMGSFGVGSMPLTVGILALLATAVYIAVVRMTARPASLG